VFAFDQVALHEIGHTLGLPHSENRQSIMNPFYQPYQSKDVELGSADRQSIQQIYGELSLSTRLRLCTISCGYANFNDGV